MSFVHTPLIRSSFLSDIVGCNVLLKLENTQPSGSFKSRGLSRLIEFHVKANPGVEHHVYSSSGGNAGLAAATCAASMGLGCTVVVPSTTKQPMIDRIRSVGAQVVVFGDQWAQADEHLRNNIMAKTGSIYCHPFDHPVIWEGNSTMIDEIRREWGQTLGLEGEDANLSRPDAVIASVGGGGLLNGVVLGLDRNGWSSVPVFAVETEPTSKLYQSMQKMEKVRLTEIKTIATSLAAPCVSDKTWELAKSRGNIMPVVVSDDMAAEATVRFAQDHKIIVEPACGASLSVVYDQLVSQGVKLTKESNIVVVVCGGTSTDLSTLQEWKTKYGL